MVDFTEAIINEDALRVCIKRSKELIEEYELDHEDAQKLGEAMAKMFQAGIAYCVKALESTK